MNSVRPPAVLGTMTLFLSIHGATAAHSHSVLVLPQAQAPGQPIVTPISPAECEEAQRLYDRLSPGMDIQEEALERTARQLDQARRGTLEITDAAKRAMGAALLGEIRAIIPELSNLKVRIGGLDTTKLTPQQRGVLSEALEIATNTESVLSSLAEGSRYGEGFTEQDRLNAERTAETVHQEMLRLKRLLFESGIAEAVAEKGAGVVAVAALRRTTAALLGAAIYRGVKFRIDVLFLGLSGVLDSATEAKAAENLDIMNREYHEIRNTVIEAKRILYECGMPPPPDRPRNLRISP